MMNYKIDHSILRYSKRIQSKTGSFFIAKINSLFLQYKLINIKNIKN